MPDNYETFTTQLDSIEQELIRLYAIENAAKNLLTELETVADQPVLTTLVRTRTELHKAFGS